MRKETIKVVYNDEYCQFVLSQEAIDWMRTRGFSGKFNDRDGACIIPRHHPLLVECVETLGERACGEIPKRYNPIRDLRPRLMVAEIPGDKYYVIDYDGKETVIGLEDLVDAGKKKDLFVDTFDAGKVFFTADTHFGSRSIIRYSNRPFRDEDQMTEELVRRWNETVPADGVVFHLGDFAHGPADYWLSILERLNGTVHLVVGNHDTASAKAKALAGFASVHAQRIIEVGGQRIYLNHYPFLCYGGAYEGGWQLFGHVHSGPMSRSGLDLSRMGMLLPNQYDVGVDNNGFRPVSFAEVREKLAAKAGTASDEDGGIRPDRDGAPIVFLDVDGVLVTDPSFRQPGSGPSEQLDWLLKESGARIVMTGGWAAFKPEDLKAGPLSAFAPHIAGTAPLAGTLKEAVAGWLQRGRAKHRYVILSATPTDDTRSVQVDPSAGLTREDVRKALGVLRQVASSEK